MQADALRPYFLIALLFGVFVLVFYILKPFLAPLAIAVIFAVVLQPLYRRMLYSTGGRHTWAAAGTVLVFTLCVLVPFVFLGTQIVAEASTLYVYFVSGEGIGMLYQIAARMAEMVAQWFPGANINLDTIAADLSAYVTQGLGLIVSHVGGLVSSITGFLLSLFVFFIALYYFLKDGPALKKKIMDFSPLRDIDEERIFSRLELAVNSVVKGNLLVAGIQGILATTGFFLFGVPNPVLWGSVTAISALVPAVGTGLVMAPVILFLGIVGMYPQAIGLTLWALLAVGLVDNILGPKLVGRGSRLHPLVILLAVLGGLSLFGTVGIFLGPLSVALLLALLAIHAEHSRST